MNSSPPRETSDGPEPTAWAVYGGKTGVLRYVLQDEDRVFELTESGYIARPLFEHPAPTPPADDVREALDADVTAPWPNTMHQVWDRLVEFSEAYRRERGYSPNEAARTRFLFAAFDVSPRGTVTDAEVEAAAQAMFEDGLAIEGDYTWAQMVAEDPTRADIWRADARRVLEAAREARS